MNECEEPAAVQVPHYVLNARDDPFFCPDTLPGAQDVAAGTAPPARLAPARRAPALPATIHPAVRTWLATSTFQKSTRTWLATPASVPALSPAPRAESRDGGRIQPPPSLPFPLPLTLLYC